MGYIEELEKRRSEILAELEHINAILKISRGDSPEVISEGPKINRTDALKAALEKADGAISLKQVVIRMQQEGFVFRTKNPENSLNSLLYSAEKPAWLGKNDEGFFLIRETVPATPGDIQEQREELHRTGGVEKTDLPTPEEFHKEAQDTLAKTAEIKEGLKKVAAKKKGR